MIPKFECTCGFKCDDRDLFFRHLEASWAFLPGTHEVTKNGHKLKKLVGIKAC